MPAREIALMHLVFAASECVPFAKPRGLADVAGAITIPFQYYNRFVGIVDGGKQAQGSQSYRINLFVFL